ncbi:MULTISPECIES: LuxR C-terminal-related transcriptional regulator [Thermoactinomyces]|jgi:DNA-binding CsgD family transcriptional regulator|uniref:LuxR C-terminal-related transcriptional regulator n=1 Tax=Thermoactinomyces TaxID=2023 RepID=UPI00110790C9|nr:MULTISPECIES: LuxR C-terminal-related transcriptional regulator [Thermoactinomyces]MBI0390822.1 GAF domain-containing protein [Thermoactinomyces sp. CICC 24226]QCV55858.1 GAF domain-containing protein [Thermoactinomyces vulgaris]
MKKEQLLDLISGRYPEGLARWHLKLSKWNAPDEEKAALSRLFSFLLDHLDLALSDESALMSRLQQWMMDETPVADPNHWFFAVGSLEQILMEFVMESQDSSFVQQAFHKIHTLCMNINQALMQWPFLTLRAFDSPRIRSYSPLVELLQGLKIRPDVRWNKIAVLTSEGKVLDLAVHHPRNNRWVAAYPTDRQTLFVRRILQGKARGFTEPVNQHLSLAISGSKNALSRSYAREIAGWIRHALRFSRQYTSGPLYDTLRQYEAILEFDDTLLSTSGVKETLLTSMKQICRLTGFQRSAFFWYYPLLKKVEGICSYNVPLEEIQRIHESEQNVPGISKLFDVKRPVYFRQVHHLLPKHHIRHFRLTSLLVAPLYEEHHHVTGVLLLDQNGQQFDVSQTTIEIIRSLLTRVSRNLRTKLYANASPLQLSSPLTHREKQILRFSANGLSTKQIAARLKISEHTVNEYIRSVFKKLHAKNRAEAVAKALRQRLIK